ncbi:MAG: c-type cytochrome [Meiothermus sp.]|nr:c-type cytochrome [Meiothermus sp.]
MFDIFGTLVLVAVIALFGFLATRTWRLKNAALRWLSVIISGLLTLIGTAALGLAVVGFVKLNQRHPNPVTDIKVVATAVQIARGQRLAHNCASCHTPGDKPPLSGVNFAQKFDLTMMGRLYAPNLTPGGNIDNWSDGEVIRAIREGIHRNGRSLLIMPTQTFSHLSDEDVQAIVAYLRSQPPTGKPTPNNQFSVIGAIFTNLIDFRTAGPPVSKVTAPPVGTVEYGKYMVDIIGCSDCHGDRLQGKADNGEPGPPPGPNLTRIIPQWIEAQFMTYFNKGQLPGGGTVPILTLPSGFSEPRMPWPTVRAIATDAELKAMYTYLHRLSPVDGPSR